MGSNTSLGYSMAWDVPRNEFMCGSTWQTCPPEKERVGERVSVVRGFEAVLGKQTTTYE